MAVNWASPAGWFVTMMGIAFAGVGCSEADKTSGPDMNATDAGGDGAVAQPGEDEIFGWVEAVTGFGVRTPGSAASTQAAEFVRDRFTEFGLEDVTIETADTIVWSASKWGLTVGGLEVPSQFMQHTMNDGTLRSFSTGEGGVTGEIVYVGDGTAEDFANIDVAGKVVVSDVRWVKYPRDLIDGIALHVHDPDDTLPADYELVDPYSRKTFPANYYNAAQRGAAGFVGVLVDYLDRNTYHNEAYASYIKGLELKIPGVWVSKSEGEAIKTRISESGTALSANLVLEGKLEAAVGKNVVGYLPGASDDIVMIESHHDSTTQGAVEDASGTSLVLALAKYYAQLPVADRPRTLLFATMDTHFTNYANHDAFIERHIEQESILACVTLEHIANEVEETATGIQLTGQLAPRVVFASNEIEGFAELATNAVIEHNLVRSAVIPTSVFATGLPADSDHFFRIGGLPIIALVGAPIYLYDSIDTLDKVAKPELENVARAFVDVVDGLGTLPRGAYRRLNE